MITRAKRRLEALGYFESVNVSTAPGSSPDRVVIVVDVKDQSTGAFGVGAGYSAGSDSILLEASVEEKNFLGRGQYIRLAAGGGTDDARSFNLSFTEPYFLGYRLAAGFDLFRSSSSSEDYYDYEETGGTLRVTAPITEDLSTTFSYTYKQMKYDGTGAWNVGDNLSYPYESLIGKDWVQSSVANKLNYNTLDSQTAPHEGIQAQLTQEFAGLGGDSDFYKISAKARAYYTLSDEADLIGSLTVQAGHVMPTSGDLKIFDQFMIGGKQIRGFENSGIGPRMNNGDALGGTSYITASAETTFPMPGIPQDFGLRGALFADAGTLFGNEVDTGGEGHSSTSAKIRASLGVGVTWASPFGPLRFDYAVPVMKEDYDKTQNFRFSIANQF
jgi:outer membrane protein insertion porin family